MYNGWDWLMNLSEYRLNWAKAELASLIGCASVVGYT